MSKVTTAKHGRLSVFLFILFVAILYGFGAYSIIDITTTFSTEIDQFLTEVAVFIPIISAGLPDPRSGDIAEPSLLSPHNESSSLFETKKHSITSGPIR